MATRTRFVLILPTKVSLDGAVPTLEERVGMVKYKAEKKPKLKKPKPALRVVAIEDPSVKKEETEAKSAAPKQDEGKHNRRVARINDCRGGGNEQNAHGVGICLVANFERDAKECSRSSYWP